MNRKPRWRFRAIATAASLALVAACSNPCAAQATALEPATLARLAALDGADPVPYVELAEEIASEADSAPKLRLARTLYALAFEIDRDADHAHRVAASACIGLAALDPIESERRWLRALAAQVDSRYASRPGAPAGEGPPIPADVRLAAASALGAARSGDGVRARRWLDDPGVPEALHRFAPVLGIGGGTSAASYVESLARGWPCPQCRGERVIRGPGDAAMQRCPTCNGDPGTALNAAQYAAQLRFEATLLDADMRSWSGQFTIDHGAPLRDPDPDELAPSLRIDPGATLWREGAWVRPDEADTVPTPSDPR